MRTDAFEQLWALSLLALALLFAPAALPPLRRYARPLRIGAVVLYFAVGAAILLRWYIFG